MLIPTDILIARNARKAINLLSFIQTNLLLEALGWQCILWAHL